MTRSRPASDAPFSRLVVLGLGLVGGSVALAARERGLAQRVIGAGGRRSRLELAHRRGLVDEIDEPAAAAHGADLLVLATPVGVMSGVLEEVAPQLSSGALVTDVGSVKAVLAETLPGLLPPGVSYVGAHPMAGSHLRGIEHARADLFEGAGCAVTPLPGTDADAVSRVVGFWQALGARVVMRDPGVHDREVAWISHLPHTLAFSFAHALAKAPRAAGELAGGGFRDFTRIARGDPKLWADILSTNRKALVGPLQACGEALSRLASAVDAGDTGALESFLNTARCSLSALSPSDFEWEERTDGIENARSGGEIPEISADPQETRSATSRRIDDNT